MHPNIFFKECDCRTGIDVFEIYDQELKNKLRETHPKNFIRTRIIHPVYRVVIDYETIRGNYKQAQKILVMDAPLSKDEDSMCWADIVAEEYLRDYNQEHPDNPMVRASVGRVDFLCEAVLKIG